MMNVDMDLDEARAGYSAFNKLLGAMKPTEKLKHAKELRKVGRVIEAVKFSASLAETPKRKPRKSTAKKGEETPNGKP